MMPFGDDGSIDVVARHGPSGRGAVVAGSDSRFDLTIDSCDIGVWLKGRELCGMQ
jgi:hypothetical protein